MQTLALGEAGRRGAGATVRRSCGFSDWMPSQAFEKCWVQERGYAGGLSPSGP
jgi:hypothetical protein